MLRPGRTYANLFAKIGVTHGAGDGSTTFNVPDARGRTCAGKGNMGGTPINSLTATKTGNVTSGSPVMSGIANTSNLSVGMEAFTAVQFPAGTKILSIDSANQITLTANALVTATAVQIDFGDINETQLGAKGGSRGIALNSGQMPAHSHSGSTDSQGAHTHTAQGVGSGGIAFATSTGNTPSEATVSTSSAGAHTHSVTVGSTGGGQNHTNVQPTIIFNKIIKT